MQMHLHLTPSLTGFIVVVPQYQNLVEDVNILAYETNLVKFIKEFFAQDLYYTCIYLGIFATCCTYMIY